MTDQLQKQLNQISLWEMERWAVQALKTVGETRMIMTIPALLELLIWAVDSKFMIEDMGTANEMTQALLGIAMTHPKTAVASLLKLDNLQTDYLPFLTEATTPEQIAREMLQLAVEVKAR